MMYKKTAIVHKSVWSMRGAERVLYEICEVFPDADIYLLFGDEAVLAHNFSGHKVKFSWLQKLPWIRKLYRYLLPFWPIAIESFDLSGYDLVISSSSDVAHGVIVPHGTKHLCYMYTPMRFLWDQADLYLAEYRPSVRLFARFFYSFLRIWDQSAIQRPDKIVVISEFVKKRLQKYYLTDAPEVIYPPCSISLRPHRVDRVNRDEYYCAIAPFEPNKGGVELIQIARQLGIKLKIVGDGPMRKKLEKLAEGETKIEFTGVISEDQKLQLLRGAKALLFLGFEDFGMSAVEAIGAGTPVIGVKGSSADEIIQEGVNGLFIKSVTSVDIREALKRLEKLDFSYQDMVKSIEKFSRERFRVRFVRAVNSIRKSDE